MYTLATEVLDARIMMQHTNCYKLQHTRANLDSRILTHKDATDTLQHAATRCNPPNTHVT